MGLNETIILCRKKAGWSQEELAERLELSRQAVSKWETGTAEPDLHNLKAMAAVFGVTADWLLSDAEDDPANATNRTDDPANPMTDETNPAVDLSKRQENAEPHEAEKESHAGPAESRRSGCLIAVCAAAAILLAGIGAIVRLVFRYGYAAETVAESIEGKEAVMPTLPASTAPASVGLALMIVPGLLIAAGFLIAFLRRRK